MKVLIIYKSVHHGNTLKVAKVIAEETNAELKEVDEMEIDGTGGVNLTEFDLIGFGSGIYNGKHHKSIMNFAEQAYGLEGRKCFVFSTASIKYEKMNQPLINLLKKRQAHVTGQFICRGFMSFSFTKLFFGGINKKHPNDGNLREAREFAGKLRG